MTPVIDQHPAIVNERKEASMEMAVDTGREFWRGVLLAGGATAVPRWTLAPVPGVTEREAAVPEGVVAGLRRLADEVDVPFSAAVLAAHATVLAALSGESEVVTGYVGSAGGRPVPCRLTTGGDSWRALVARTAATEAALRAHGDFPIEDLRRELGVPGPVFETVVARSGTGGLASAGLGDGIAVAVEAAAQGDRLGLRVRYRTDVLDAGSADRFVGYHLRALELIATDPEGVAGQASLLSAAELDFQLHGLAGPRRELPDRRMHELFEERVRRQPDAVAAVFGNRSWSYRELNARANQVGRALRQRGLGREGVVAVVCERNLDWLAGVLGVFKAGGVYLPIEPHFPADRIATTLLRAECGLVLTETGSTTTLDKALDSVPGARVLLVDEAYAEGHADDDLGIPVGPDQLAYIYFTSGSTGTPKGAMCEHAGMLNHLYAKINDLGIDEGAVVAQVAPQCFDISLWQLVSALLVGGRTVLVGQDVILDVGRFVDTVDAAGVAVLQVVPSYLEVVLTYLEQHPRELPALQCVSVTGEALKKELAERFFALRPGVTLVNAYGLTETSDDTNHEVMTRPPTGDRVPLGPTVQNVAVYVVDENLVPVPLGAPGLIVFSGVCVGRGYVNDPDRTAAAYLIDPHRPGQRLYRGGDYGRWLPGGTLDFLGRRDNQVKISGFRIEVGEIDNTLLRVPGVRDGAVVVAERPDRGRYLVAFYSGPHPLEVDVLRERLGRSLPHYMVPVAFHWQDSLPLTGNGKIDTKALAVLAAQLDLADATDEADPPRTPTELRLAAAYAQVLGVPADQVGRLDHFFDRGGSSLSAVKLAVALNREVSLKDVTRHPVLAALADLVDSRSAPVDTGSVPVGAKRSTRLLQTLSEPDGAQAPALVCFPYAGGNAVNYQPLAQALRSSGVTVHAVELPGHDLGTEPEAFAPLTQVAEQVTGEILERCLTGVMLWGHSAGAALALETARQLQDRGTVVRRVFLAAQLPRTAADRRAAADRLVQRTDAEITAELSAEPGYTALAELDARRAAHVGAAYRHDVVTTHRYLADVLDAAPTTTLSAPVTVVLADDDASTAGSYHDWKLLADHVDLYRLADGGHYFLRTRPAQAAHAVLHACAPVAAS
jgi:amino acid adenylation domain-containing protein